MENKCLLIVGLKNIFTLDEDSNVYSNADICIKGKEIIEIGKNLKDKYKDGEIIDGSEKIALPGFVNTHHHFFQNLSRAIPLTQGMKILPWLKHSYALWSFIDEEYISWATKVAAAELLLTGCTTTNDFHYFIPYNRVGIIDESIKAAREIGIRFHPTRASMTEMEGSLIDELATMIERPEDLVEREEVVLSECERIIKKYHDSGPFSMCRISVGPTEKTYGNPRFMRDLADLADKYEIMKHTHLHPRKDEIEFCHNKLGCTPIEFLESVGWLTNNTWLSHGTNLTGNDMLRMVDTGVALTHCPTSNLKLRYGVAPILQAINMDLTVGLGVDGGASNDTGDFIGEMRNCFMVHRINGVHPDDYMPLSVEDVLRLGTIGGAKVLQRDDLGTIATGKAADIVLFDLNSIGYTGSPGTLTSLILCGFNHTVDTVFVNGEIVVQKSRLVNIDQHTIVEEGNRLARQLIRNAKKHLNIDFTGSE